MDHDAVLRGLELGRALRGPVSFEVVEARDEEVVGRGDSPCHAPEIDHQAAPVIVVRYRAR